MERIWKQAPVAQFEVVPGGTKKNHDRWCLGKDLNPECPQNAKLLTTLSYLYYYPYNVYTGTNNLETYI
jgi:hypothetical protein